MSLSHHIIVISFGKKIAEGTPEEVANNKLVQYVLNHGEGENTKKICEQLYDLAQLSHGSLTPERMTKFIARSNEIMGMMLN